MQVNLEREGTFVWTTDQFHVAENHAAGQLQGWLARAHTAWTRSLRVAQRLQRLFNAHLIFGHDKEVAEKFIEAKKFYE